MGVRGLVVCGSAGTGFGGDLVCDENGDGSTGRGRLPVMVDLSIHERCHLDVPRHTNGPQPMVQLTKANDVLFRLCDDGCVP